MRWRDILSKWTLKYVLFSLFKSSKLRILLKQNTALLSHVRVCVTGVDKLDHQDYPDHLDHIDNLGHLDHLEPPDHLHHLDYPDHSGKVDHLDHIDNLDHLDNLDPPHLPHM